MYSICGINGRKVRKKKKLLNIPITYYPIGLLRIIIHIYIYRFYLIFPSSWSAAQQHCFIPVLTFLPYSYGRFSCLFNIINSLNASLSKPLSLQLIHLNVSIFENKLYTRHGDVPLCGFATTIHRDLLWCMMGTLNAVLCVQFF